MVFSRKIGKAGLIFTGTVSMIFVAMQFVYNILDNCFSSGQKLHHDLFDSNNGKEHVILFEN